MVISFKKHLYFPSKVVYVNQILLECFSLDSELRAQVLKQSDELCVLYNY